MARKINNVTATPALLTASPKARRLNKNVPFSLAGSQPTVWAEYLSQGYRVGFHQKLALADFSGDLVEHARYRMAVAEAKVSKTAARAEKIAAKQLAKINKADAKRDREIARQRADHDLHGKKGRRYAAGLRSSVRNMIKMGIERSVINQVIESVMMEQR